MENGKINTLDVARKDQKGFYLQNQKGQEIFLSSEETELDLEVGSSVEVFIYKDRERIVSTRLPYAQVEEFAFLNVKFLTEQGAYVDWGLEKDLFVPLEEQMETLEVDSNYLFFVYEDEDNGSIRGSQRVEDFVFVDKIDVKRGDEVDLLLYRESNLGMNVVVNNQYQGLIFKSDIHKEVEVGEQIKGFVKQVREDGKIDILLEPLGYKKSVESNTDILLKAIKKADNFLPLTDKSKPEEIKSSLGLSKKAFKRAAGHLYKKKLIEIRTDGLHLVTKK
ncbi:MAG: GntR family transcriptional regulator [Flavobacteriales bacterium]|nr:GntR family transcriptional regulator [Flavobacteriales bacterium]